METFYPDSPWVCVIKFVQVVVPLALSAEILADIIWTWEMFNIRTLKNLLRNN